MKGEAPLKVVSEGLPRVENLPDGVIRLLLTRLNITKTPLRLDDHKESRDLSPVLEGPE
jgi:hypothetical protein